MINTNIPWPIIPPITPPEENQPVNPPWPPNFPMWWKKPEETPAITPAVTAPAIQRQGGTAAINELMRLKRQYEALGGRLSSAETEGLVRGVLSSEGERLFGMAQMAREEALTREQMRIQQEQFAQSYKLQEKQLEQMDQDSGTVICSELHRQGYITDEELKLDSSYRIKYIDNNTYIGYLSWATMVVELMQKSKIITRIIKPFGIGWAREMAHRIEPENHKGSFIGKVLLKWGVPICRCIGKFKMKLIRRVTYV